MYTNKTRWAYINALSTDNNTAQFLFPNEDMFVIYNVSGHFMIFNLTKADGYTLTTGKFSVRAEDMKMPITYQRPLNKTRRSRCLLYAVDKAYNAGTRLYTAKLNAYWSIEASANVLLLHSEGKEIPLWTKHTFRMSRIGEVIRRVLHFVDKWFEQFVTVDVNLGVVYRLEKVFHDIEGSIEATPIAENGEIWYIVYEYHGYTYRLFKEINSAIITGKGVTILYTYNDEDAPCVYYKGKVWWEDVIPVITRTQDEIVDTLKAVCERNVKSDYSEACELLGNAISHVLSESECVKLNNGLKANFT